MIGNWALFLDDTRRPAEELPILAQKHSYAPNESVIWCQTVDTAKWHTEHMGPPYFMYLDYGLGMQNSMPYLTWLKETFPAERLPWGEPPEYIIISASPNGADEIEAFMKNWHTAA